MFLGPLEAMKPWNPRGIEGVHRFLQKVWRELIAQDGSVHARIIDGDADAIEFTRLLHETIKKVGDDIEGLRFNTAISQMMIFTNALQKAPTVNRKTALTFLQLLAPFAPHFAEEVWARLGGVGSIMASPWPDFDPQKLATTTVKLVFQVNGKHRGDQLVPIETTEEQAVAVARENPRVAPHLEGRRIKRIIFVKGKILNIVVE
jgi:leucyl-tRNA synthetase